MQVHGCLCLWGQCIVKKQSLFSLNVTIKENQEDMDSFALSVSFLSFFLFGADLNTAYSPFLKAKSTALKTWK